jgi:1,3-beta-glucanosyltransferase GAS1
MRATSRFAAVIALAGAVLTGVDAIQTVTRNGRYLYTADGNRFYIKGVAYQEQGKSISLIVTSFMFTSESRCGGCGPEQSFP